MKYYVDKYPLGYAINKRQQPSHDISPISVASFDNYDDASYYLDALQKIKDANPTWDEVELGKIQFCNTGHPFVMGYANRGNKSIQFKLYATPKDTEILWKSDECDFNIPKNIRPIILGI